jgi:uncharacterized membrane protein YqjE
MNQQLNNTGRSITAVLADMKEELKQFVETRISILSTELREKLKVWKIAAPLAAAAIILLLTAYLLFTISLVGLLFTFLPDTPYRWSLAFLGVAVLWSILGGIAGYFAKREFELKGLLPQKTIDVLKGDKLWIQSEVKSHL